MKNQTLLSPHTDSGRPLAPEKVQGMQLKLYAMSAFEISTFVRFRMGTNSRASYTNPNRCKQFTYHFRLRKTNELGAIYMAVDKGFANCLQDSAHALRPAWRGR